MKEFFKRHNDYFLRLAITVVLAATIYLITIQFLSSSFFACVVSVVAATYMRIIIMELLERRKKRK